jgi:hypothetical protein
MLHLEWLLPILLAFWILINLIRKTEEERRNRERGTPNGEQPPSPPRQRRPNADIDRFLEEVNRRRSQAAERKPRPAAESRGPTPRRSVPAAVRREPPSPPRQPAPQTVEAVVVIPEVQPALVRQRSAVPAREATVTPRPAGPPSTVLDLLRSKESIRAALILREILSPPLCRRAPWRPRADSQ